MYDAIVVGARCGGAPTAMLLARQGHRILLVDRATYTSDIPHGHFIHRHGPKRLHAWGLLGRISDTGCPAVTTLTTHFGDYAMTGRDLEIDGVALGYGPRRSNLDAILIDAAVEAGVEYRERFLVEEYLSEDGVITGIRGRDTRTGATVTETARITIGANGRNSALARTVDAPVIDAIPTLTCWYFSYWSDVESRGLEVYASGQRVVFAFPTNDDLLAIFVAWPREMLATVREDIEGEFLRVLDSMGELGERVRAGHREEPFRGATDLPNFIRTAHGPGWALVGDAACHKDPYLALGVCDAFRDAELLAAALDDAWAERTSMDDAMTEFEQQRLAATREDFLQNAQFARMQPFPAQTLGLRAAIRGDQPEINRFCLANEGMIPPQEFFNPENLGRIMSRLDPPKAASLA